jgi:TonB family protein
MMGELTMDVTDVLRDRMHEPSGFERMAAVSIAAHVVFVAVLLLAPAQWWSRNVEEPPTVMTITLGGGGEGPRNGGLTTMGGRPVQVETPPEAVKRPEPVRPPAAKTPDMTLPRPAARPTRASPAPAVAQAPDDARGRTPTSGEETSAGSTSAVTGVRGQGFGLSTGGGPGSGSSLDVADFCCPDYLVLMIERIRTNWAQRQEVAGQVIVRFAVQRDGQLLDVTLEQSSGYPILDLAAQRAIVLTRQLPPLPAAFPNPTLTVHLNFQYRR